MPTLVHRIREAAETAPGRPALFGPVRAEWRQLSLGSWWSSVRQAAGGLVSLGLVPDEPVVLWGPAQPEWAVIWPALCAIGAIPVLMAPNAEDADLVAAIAEPEVHRVVTSGRERLERLLLLREHTSLGLERVITLDRPALRVPRLSDLEELIEKGGMRSDHVEQRMAALTPDSVAAVLPSGARLSHRALLEASPDAAGGVYLDESPAARASLLAMAAAMSTGSELWMGGLADDLLGGLRASSPGAALLTADGWRTVRGALDSEVDGAGGLRGTLIRLARGNSRSGVVHAAAAPVLQSLGLERCRGWCDVPLDADLSAALGAMGLVVGPPGH